MSTDRTMIERLQNCMIVSFWFFDFDFAFCRCNTLRFGRSMDLERRREGRGGLGFPDAPQDEPNGDVANDQEPHARGPQHSLPSSSFVARSVRSFVRRRSHFSQKSASSQWKSVSSACGAYLP